MNDLGHAGRVARHIRLTDRGVLPVAPSTAVHVVTNRPLVDEWPEQCEFIMFGMGCFWSAERIFWQLDGVWTTFAAYAGGDVERPNYMQVCSGNTGHAEVVGVVYDPAVVELATLLAAFWENHDPTQGMRQGNDVGSQYRSIVLTTTDEQAEVVAQSQVAYQQALDAAGYGSITTTIEPLASWWLAEDYHQQYLVKNPGGYCNHGFCQTAYPVAATPSTNA